MENTALKFPTEIIDLPSKGLVYPKENLLSEGKVEMKYMTARSEDILTNQSYIEKGIVLDKLLEDLVVTKINIKDLIVGDKNALLIAARVLGYGKEYKFTLKGEEITVDLSILENKEFDTTSGTNEFSFTLPHSGNEITYKILTGHDESLIDQELKGLKKLNKNASPELSTRLKYIITSIGGERDTKSIREFVDNYLLARDSRSLREHIKQNQPDVDLEYVLDGGEEVFGLTRDYRAGLFKQIHEIVFHGKGGYDYETVYNLPIWLRKYTFSEIQKHYEAEAEASKSKSSTTTQLVDEKGNVNVPAFAKASKEFSPPTYSTKANKK